MHAPFWNNTYTEINGLISDHHWQIPSQMNPWFKLLPQRWCWPGKQYLWWELLQTEPNSLHALSKSSGRDPSHERLRRTYGEVSVENEILNIWSRCFLAWKSGTRSERESRESGLMSVQNAKRVSVRAALHGDGSGTPSGNPIFPRGGGFSARVEPILESYWARGERGRGGGHSLLVIIASKRCKCGGWGARDPGGRPKVWWTAVMDGLSRAQAAKGAFTRVRMTPNLLHFFPSLLWNALISLALCIYLQEKSVGDEIIITRYNHAFENRDNSYL